VHSRAHHCDVFVLYVLTMAAGLIVIRLSRGTHGPWVETLPDISSHVQADGDARPDLELAVAGAIGAGR
jgi:hypothetical protein